nr:hypothetical protein [uncultured bacterium]
MNERGFTLVELMVAMTLFAVVMLVAVGALLSMVDANRKARALENVMNNLNIAIDGMVRSVRMGNSYHCNSVSVPNMETDDGDCLNGSQGAVEIFSFAPFGANPLEQTERWVYTFVPGSGNAGGRIERSRSGGSNPVAITAPEVDIEDVTFYVDGTERTNGGALIPPSPKSSWSSRGRLAAAMTGRRRLFTSRRLPSSASSTSDMERLRTSEHGMTLVETLVAVSILSIAIVAPMTLTMRSLSAAYYARDQVIMSNLAQEGIEAVRALRDANILTIATNSEADCSDGGPMQLLCGIPIDQVFTIDARKNPPEVGSCGGVEEGECGRLMTDGNLYGHDSTWTTKTPYKRTIRAEVVAGINSTEDENGEQIYDEIRVQVVVTRDDSTYTAPEVVIVENLYRWVNDGSGN